MAGRSGAVVRATAEGGIISQEALAKREACPARTFDGRSYRQPERGATGRVAFLARYERNERHSVNDDFHSAPDWPVQAFREFPHHARSRTTKPLT